MKTLHLTNAWHASSGGIGTFYRALMDAANREGHAMRLVVPGDESRVEDVGEFGRIYTIAAPCAPLNRNYRMLYPPRFLFPKTAIQRILNDEQPDLVEIAEKYTLPYLGGLLRTGRLPGVTVKPTVVGLSCERMDENLTAYLTRNPLGQLFCRFYMKWIYFPMFDHHIAVSEHTAGELASASRGHKVQRGVWIMPMGVDCERFTPEKRTAEDRAELLREAGGDDGTTVLFYAGRLAPEKNVPLLVETMKRLNRDGCRMVIAGSGIMLEEMQRECERCRLPVTFLGHVGDPERLARLYANADVFLHPNPREPFGIAPLEAMAAGLALVAPNSGGVISYANEGNAWLTEANPDAFAAAVRGILSEPDSCPAKKRAARETAEQYRWPNVTKQFLQLYRELNAWTRGERLSLTTPPRLYSTRGDSFGREIPGSY